MLFEKIKYQDDFPINVNIVKITDYPIHYHQDTEFLLVLKGEIKLKVFCSNYVLKEGDIFTISGHEVHGITAEDPNNIIAIIQISTLFFSQYFPELSKSCFMTGANNNNDFALDELKRMLLEILLSYYQRKIDYKQLCTREMINVINYLNEFFNLFSFRGKEIFNFKHENKIVVERISRIINYVYEKYPFKISLNDLANEEHLSTYYISHIVYECMGISFREFLAFARVEMSEILLLETEKKISKIAKEVGFSSTSYYETNFEKWFGHSPSEHRELCAPHVLSENRLADLEHLSDSRVIQIIKRALSEIISQKNSNSKMNILHFEISVDPQAQPIMETSKSLEIMFSLDDFNSMKSKFFSVLTDLKVTRLLLVLSKDDCKFDYQRIINRLNYLGFTVKHANEDEILKLQSSGFDSFAYCVQIIKSYCSQSNNSIRCLLRDSSISNSLTKKEASCLTSSLLPKPAFHMFKIMQNIRGNLTYWGKYYYIFKNSFDGEDSYTVIVANYNDAIDSLCLHNATPFEVYDAFNEFIDELSIDFNFTVTPGKYIVSKYTISNKNSCFSYLADLGFPESDTDIFQETWAKILSTEPQTQVSIEETDKKLSIHSSISGAGIDIFIIKKMSI